MEKPNPKLRLKVKQYNTGRNIMTYLSVPKPFVDAYGLNHNDILLVDVLKIIERRKLWSDK